MKLLQKGIALLVCCALCFSMSGCMAFSSLRPEKLFDTEHAQPQPTQNRSLDLSKLTYVPFDGEAFLQRLETARDRTAQPDSGAWLMQEYREMAEQLKTAQTSFQISELLFYQDSTDTEASDKSAEAYTVYVDCADAFSIWLGELMKSEYRQTYINEVGEERALLYEDYSGMSDREKELTDREKALTDEYTTVSQRAYEDNEALANAVEPIYLQLLDVRKQLAEECGYDSYAEYVYEMLYYRSYTPEDARRLEEYVKENIAPLYLEDCLMMDYDVYDAAESHAYTGEEAILHAMQTYLPQMDPSLGEALDRMLENKAYDIADSDTKYDMSCTVRLEQYGTPYIFSKPDTVCEPYALDTTVHEFGHFYAMSTDPIYRDPDGYLYATDDLDVSEVNSTGLELLFMQYYPQLYGEDADAVRQVILSDVLSNVVYGCVFDEFQQRVYDRAQLEPGEVSEICHDVLTDYFGDVFYDDYSYYCWASVIHNFEVPFYYISYCMSALAALQLWQQGERDPDGALQTYLDFTAYGASVDFVSLLQMCGMEDVFDPTFLRKLTDRLETAFS